MSATLSQGSSQIEPKNLIKGGVIIVFAAIFSYLIYQILPYDNNANKGLALLLFIGVLWLTEAIHITVTALLVPVLAVILQLPFEGSRQNFTALNHH